MKIGLDTNILVYATSPQGDPRKHAIAMRVVEQAGETGQGVLALQALTEFYAVITRRAGTKSAKAAVHVQTWSDTFPVVSPEILDVVSAMQLHRDHQIAFWDAMLLSTYQRAGVKVLLSEDFQDGRMFGELRILNPFAVDAGSGGGPLGLHEDSAAWRHK